MFAKLAFKNIKRSIKDYAIYFFTLVLGVAIFYVFNSLGSQSVMMDVNERVRSMMELVNVIMGVVSVFVSCILGALIIYASRFLIKRRGKEFGIYLTLGMSKRKISLILLIETFLIGLFSLAVGLLLGVVASQFASVLVANMFDANLTNFHFVFSWSAFLQTLLYFGIIYVVVMIFNTINISRQKLINLLSSNRRNEKIKNKNLWVCTLVFIVASVVLGVAYYLVTSGLEVLTANADGPDVLLIPIAMGIVATFLLFWSLSGISLRIVMSFKSVYHKKLNAFVLRQFSSKINTTVASMSAICLMLFVTICILGSALAINKTMHDSIERALPMDAQVTSIGRNAPSIEEIYRRENVNLDELLTDTVSYTKYILDNVTLESINGDNQNNNSSFIGGSNEFVYEKDYNRIAQLFSLPKLDLKKDEYAIVANYRQMMEIHNQSLKAGKKLTIQGQTLHPKYDHCIEGTLRLETASSNGGIFVIPDGTKLGSEDIYQREYILGNFAYPDRAEEIEKKLMSINNRFYNDDDGEEGAIYGDDEYPEIYYYSVDTKQSIIDNSVGTSALVTFVGLYVGIIFLISSAAVLALKELSESSDNRDKYTVLRKIGAGNSMLNKALFWQIFIFFLFPLLIAILHSVFGLMFCDFLVSTMGGINIMQTLPSVAVILAVIYGGYFLITYLCSRNIIRERRN